VQTVQNAAKVEPSRRLSRTTTAASAATAAATANAADHVCDPVSNVSNVDANTTTTTAKTTAAIVCGCAAHSLHCEQLRGRRVVAVVEKDQQQLQLQRRCQRRTMSQSRQDGVPLRNARKVRKDNKEGIEEWVSLG
jgi:hypothetical protein